MFRSKGTTPSRVVGRNAHGDAASVEGADFGELPQEVQEAVKRGLFGKGQKWCLLSDLLKAEPGRLIAVARELRGWSQQKLAEMAGVRQPEVSLAENQFEQSKLVTVRRIAKALEIPIPFLVTEPESRDSG